MANKVMPGAIKPGNVLDEYWQIDFTELHRQGVYKSLLVLVDTFSGWPEAFPCHTNQVREVAKVLLNQIIPRLGVPLGMSSDRGSHLIAEVVQQLRKALGIAWDLHSPYRHQASGKVE